MLISSPAGILNGGVHNNRHRLPYVYRPLVMSSFKFTDHIRKDLTSNVAPAVLVLDIHKYTTK